MSKNNGMIPKQKRHPQAPRKKWVQLSAEERQYIFEKKKELAAHLKKEYPNCTEHNLKNAIQQTWGSYLSDRVLKQIMNESVNDAATLTTDEKRELTERDREIERGEFTVYQSPEDVILDLCSHNESHMSQCSKYEAIFDTLIEVGFTARQIANHALVMLGDRIK